MSSRQQPARKFTGSEKIAAMRNRVCADAAELQMAECVSHWLTGGLTIDGPADRWEQDDEHEWVCAGR